MVAILPQLLVNALITGSLYALVSAGLVLTYSVLRVLNFAHGHLMMLGGYTFLFFQVEGELGVLPAAVCSAVVMVVVALITLSVFIAPFTRSNTLLPLVSTIALGTMIESGVSLLFGVNVRAFPNQAAHQSLEWYGIFFTPLEGLIVVSAVALLFFIAVVVHHSPLGRTIRAIAEHPAAAEGLGISAQRVSRATVIGAVLITTYAGVLIGLETNLTPTMGSAYSIKALAAMVLGGLGNVWGTVAAAFSLGLIENLVLGLNVGDYSLPAGYKDGFAFAIILMVLLLRPSGLFGTRLRST